MRKIILMLVLSLMVSVSFAKTKYAKGKINLKVYFDYSSTKIHPVYHAELDNLAWSLKNEHPTKTLKIIGFADKKGSKKNNTSFSKKRAESIKKYLTHWHNIPSNRIECVAMGFIKGKFGKVSKIPKIKTYSVKKLNKAIKNLKNNKDKKMYKDLASFDKEGKEIKDTYYFDKSAPKKDDRLKDRVVIFELK